jgi:thiol:disulfide interchange protein DsbD
MNENPTEERTVPVGPMTKSTRPSAFTGGENVPSRTIAACRSAMVLLLVLAVQAAVSPLSAQDDDPSPHSEARLVPEVVSVRPGEAFTVAVHFDLEPGWHNYWRNAGDSGLPTTIEWDLPPGFEAGEIQWPYPHRIIAPPLVDYGYSDEVALLVEISPPAGLPPGDTVELAATVDWLVCREICLPATQEVRTELPVLAETPSPDPEWTELFARTRDHIPEAVPGWEARARLLEEGYELSVFPTQPDLTLPDSVYFFPGQGSVIAHAATQAPRQVGDTLRLTLQASPYAASPTPVLEGVLRAEEGGSWAEDGDVVALAIRSSVDGVPTPDQTVEEDATGGDPQGQGPGIAGGAGGEGSAGSPEAAGTLTLSLALLFAFLGGILLNLMPCVFPVLSIKILGVAGQGGMERKTVRKDGFFFGVGVVLSFLALAGILIALRAGGAQLGWGFQLQAPLFVAAMAALFFAIGLNLMGTFEIGTSLTRFGNRMGSEGGIGESLGSGVLATIIATPCTAPFMGAALGFALTRSVLETLLVFGILGLGMALPYVILSMAPGLLERLPRPGPWMETLRNILAFPMFATVIWLLWVFGQQTGITGTAYLLGGLLFLAMAAWMVGRWPRTDLRSGRLARVVSVLVILAAAWFGWRGSAMESDILAATSGWQPFSTEEVSRTLAASRPVFVDFTAAWCLTCQVNERLVLSTEEVQTAFRERNVALFKADWTRQDPEITAALEELGRSGVPVYALYRGGEEGEEPHLLPAVLTKEIVLGALTDVLSSSGGEPIPSPPDH